MRKILKNATATGVVTLFLLAAATSARADNLQLFTSRTLFGGNDMVDWGQLGATCLTQIPNNFFARSMMGTTHLNGYFAGGIPGEVRIQTFGCWNGNFAPGDVLVETRSGCPKIGNGPLTLNFCEPLIGVGAQIQAGSFGAFTAEIEVFNFGTSLGSFTEDGNSTPAGDDSAIFIGVKDLDGRNITSVTFSLTAAVGDINDFAINKLALDTGGPIALDSSLGNQTASGDY